MKHYLENAGVKLFGHLIWAGGSVVALYWLTESAIHSFWLDDGPFLSHVFRPDAHEIWMRFIVTLLILIFVFYCQTIIGRLHQTKAELKAREKEALTILENNPAAIILLDAASRTISYANRNAQRVIGMSLEDLTKRRYQTFFRRNVEEECSTADLREEENTSEMELVTSTGITIPILKSSTGVHYNNRPHLLKTFFDISEQKKMQQAIHDAHSELNQIFQTASVGMRVIDRNYNIVKVNRSFSELCGVAPDQAIGRKCYDVFAGNMCNGASCPLRTALNGKDLTEYEVNKVRADGSVLICSLTVTRFEGAEGLIGIVEAFKDITALKSTEYQLQAERDRLHNILFHQFEAVGIINQEYVVEYKNEILKQYTREKNKKRCYEIFRHSATACQNCLMQKAHNTQKIQRYEFEEASGKSYEYTYTPFLDINNERKVVISRRDISEAKALKAAAINSERLAGIGELAAGVAHEINNPINGIINYAQILVNKTEPGSHTGEIAGRIIVEGDRIAAIVASLLSFSRRDDEKRQLVRIEDLLKQSLILTGAQLKKDNIQLSVNLCADLPPVYVIPHELVQIFINLINNSRYFLNERHTRDNSPKKLDIDIDRLNDDGAGPRIRIALSDNGTGIPENLLERVLNPFFSTKPQGKGTGLGLTISKRIVEDHGGSLIIDSIAESFTKVTITLPAHAQASEKSCDEREHIDC